MTALLLTVLMTANGLFAFVGVACCSPWRWPQRLEYGFRCTYRTWDVYWPIAVPLELNEELY